MNGLPPTHLAPKGSLPLPHRGHGRPCGPRRFFQKPLSNMPLRFLASRQLQISIKEVLAPPPNVFTPTTPPCRCQCRQRRSTSLYANPILIELSDNTIPVSPIILEEDFHIREDAYLTFPPAVNDSTTRKAIGCFQVNNENAVKYIDHVYCYCS